MTKKYILFLMLVLALSACGENIRPQQGASFTPPAMSVTITRQNCPSMEASVGMWLGWQNGDTVPLAVRIDEYDENGRVIGIGRSQIGPGDFFTMQVTGSGPYRFYCSEENTDLYGTITVVNPSPAITSFATLQCAEKEVPPVLTEIQPAQAVAGGDITVIGMGGLIQDSCGSVNESARVFQLYLDNEPVADLTCYVNHCETKFHLAPTMTEGIHCFSTQKDACEFEFQVLKE